MQKVIFIFLSLIVLQLKVVAQSTDGTITIQQSSTTVTEVLKSITAQTGMDFSYNARKIDGKKKISFFVKEATLNEALNLLTQKVPVTYILVDQQIILKYKAAQEQEEEEVEETPLEEQFTISGFVRDQSSGESLIGATVAVEHTSIGTTTNEFGFYSLRLPQPQCRVVVSYVGFDAQGIDLTLTNDETKNIQLTPVSMELPSVIVSRSLKEIMDHKILGQMEMTPDDLENMPEFAGESGLIKGLQSLPGIKMHSDGSAFFFTRGGAKDQNLIIIDDAPIYNPSHLFGFYSVVIPDFTKSIQVYKSDIPANLGDRLSAIIDIRTKDGNSNKWEFSGSVNPLINRFSVEGPVIKKRGAIFLSYRRSNFDWLYRVAAPNLNFVFGDFSFKWNHRINNKNRLFFTLLNSTDSFTNGNNALLNASGLAWGNFATTLRWNHIYNAKLFSNTTVYIGSYNYTLLAGDNRWQSGIGTLNFKWDFTYFANPTWKLKYGLEAHGHFFNPGTIAGGGLSRLFPTIQQDYSQNRVLYAQSEYAPSEKWQVNAGLRLTSWGNQGPAEYYTFDEQYNLLDTITPPAGRYQTYSNADPRISVQYQLDTTSSLKASYGVYHQYLQLISNSVSPFTSLEVWLPSSPNIAPQWSTQVELSYLKYFPQTNVEFSAGLYYKKLNNQVDYEPHAKTLLNPFIEGELRYGEMNAYGLELMLRKKLGRLHGWMSYTYSRALRQTPSINNGAVYPAFQDRPHDFSILLNYQLKKRAFLSTYFTAYTGSAFSSPTGFYQLNGITLPIYGEKNNDRLPGYQRLDLALKFLLHKNEDARFQHSLSFSIYNVLAKRNIVAVNFNKVLGPNGNPVIQSDFVLEQDLITTQTNLVRFFPSLTYKFKI